MGYYNPAIGRFTQMDTHWNVGNMIYGDNPLVLRQYKDALGLDVYTYEPILAAIRQSGNLYGYCGNNPIMLTDTNGDFFFLVTAAIGLVVGAVVGGVIAAATGKNVWAGIGIGAAAGGVIGLTMGAGAAFMLTGSALATTADVVTSATLAAALGGTGITGFTAKVVASSWQGAEDLLRTSMGSVNSVLQRTLSTPFGNRVCDALNTMTRTVGEAKYGYQSLSSFIQSEVQRDGYLVTQGYTVEWHFYWSEISNSGGMSKELLEALLKAGIKVVIDY